MRRTIALVVDDLGLSFESTVHVRNALKKFVDKQMQPGDLAATIRTGAGMGALQQFTSDKRLLYAAIERVRWNAHGRSGVSAFAPIQSAPTTRASDDEKARKFDGEVRQAALAADEFREEFFSVGTLGALNFVLRGLRWLPGRKSVVSGRPAKEKYRTATQWIDFELVKQDPRLTTSASRTPSSAASCSSSRHGRG